MSYNKPSPAACNGGISFLGLLAIVFITLKLVGVISWSWWYVLMPIWLPFVFVLALCMVVFVLTLR